MKLATLTAALLLATAPAAYAGSGHDHGHSHGGSTHSHGKTAKKIDDKGAIAAASKGVAAIIEQKKLVDGAALDAAWATTAEADKKISKKGNGYYIVSFAGKDALAEGWNEARLQALLATATSATPATSPDDKSSNRSDCSSSSWAEPISLMQDGFVSNPYF